MGSMHKQGLIIVLSAPSGAGKTTLAHMLVKRRPHTRFSISCTTRDRRPGEREGRDYFFVSEKMFSAQIARRQFVEWASVHGHRYGTLRSQLRRAIARGEDIILDIDVQGGLQIKKQFPAAVLVFVAAPSMTELARRLRKRRQDSAATIRQRLVNARREMAYKGRYDYIVVNDTVEQAYAEMAAIVTAEHVRVHR